MQAYRASYYNLRVANGDALILFNGVTSALLSLPKHLRSAIDPFLGPQRDWTAGQGYASWQPPIFNADSLAPSLKRYLPTLLEAGVFVEAEHDERHSLATSYKNHRAQAPFFVTITTTLDCNMRCYYCYQKDGNLEHMSYETCDSIIGWIKDKLIKEGLPSLSVDWYGGEPMLNQPIIERFSDEMTRFCDERGVRYSASMLCNGTEWPADPVAFVKANRLSRIQFSLDGPKRHHDKRRSLTGSKLGQKRVGSYDEVMKTVKSLIGHTKIYLRINVDPKIGWDCLEVLDACAEMQWLKPDIMFYPYIAIINAMTEHCGFIGKSPVFEKFNVEYDAIQRAFYSRLASFRDAKVLEVVQYYPNRVTINCAAVNNNSIVFGPNGLMYKCGLDVGDHHRAHASIKNDAGNLPDEVPRLPAERWDNYDPFTHDRCKECQYLPICMGGCPKAQIEKDSSQVALQSAFWENNVEKIIREYYAASGHT